MLWVRDSSALQDHLIKEIWALLTSEFVQHHVRPSSSRAAKFGARTACSDNLPCTLGATHHPGVQGSSR